MSVFDFLKRTNPKIKDEILRLAKNEIAMQTDSEAKVDRPDASKIGGKPFLPVNFNWPVFTGKDDGITRPLSFFCQLDLSQLAPFDLDKQLPQEGLLSFFYECESFCWGFDPKDKGAARVYYFADTTGFAPFDIPAQLEEGYVMPEIAVQFHAKKSYPMFDDFTVLSDLECDWEAYDRVLNKLGVDTDEDPEGHKILGYADIIQNEMLSECERVTRGLYCGSPESYLVASDEENAQIAEKARDWTLLLQLGTIETDGFAWMFGDCGMLYFYITKEDLRQRRFENTWFSLQCG